MVNSMTLLNIICGAIPIIIILALKVKNNGNINNNVRF